MIVQWIWMDIGWGQNNTIFRPIPPSQECPAAQSETSTRSGTRSFPAGPRYIPMAGTTPKEVVVYMCIMAKNPSLLLNSYIFLIV